MPSTTIRYPQGTFGYSPGDPSNSGGVVEFFESTGAIFRGAAVELDFTAAGRVKQATTTPTATGFVGISQDAAAGTGEVVGVVMMGHAICRASGAIAAGDNLDTSATVSGEMVKGATAAFGTVKAVALETKGAAAQHDVRCLVVRL